MKPSRLVAMKTDAFSCIWVQVGTCTES
jgi:hypothetical protein